MSIALVILALLIGIPAAFVQFRQSEKEFWESIYPPKTYLEGLKAFMPFSLLCFSSLLVTCTLIGKMGIIETLKYSIMGLAFPPIAYSLNRILWHIDFKFGRWVYWTVPACLIVLLSFLTDGKEGAVSSIQFLFYAVAFMISGNLAYHFLKQNTSKLMGLLLYAMCLAPILLPLFIIPNTIFQTPLNNHQEGLSMAFLWFYISMFIIGLLCSFIIRKTNEHLS